MHHRSRTIRGDERPLIGLTTRGLLAVAITRLEARWDHLERHEQSLILDVLNLVAGRDQQDREAPVKRVG